MKIEITNFEASCLVDFFEHDFIPMIQNNPEVTNFQYVLSMIDFYRKVKQVVN